MLDRGYERSTILTITVEHEDEMFVKGKDKDSVHRGLRKDSILDWMESEKDNYGRN